MVRKLTTIRWHIDVAVQNGRRLRLFCRLKYLLHLLKKKYLLHFHTYKSESVIDKGTNKYILYGEKYADIYPSGPEILEKDFLFFNNFNNFKVFVSFKILGTKINISMCQEPALTFML